MNPTTGVKLLFAYSDFLGMFHFDLGLMHFNLGLFDFNLRLFDLNLGMYKVNLGELEFVVFDEWFVNFLGMDCMWIFADKVLFLGKAMFSGAFLAEAVNKNQFIPHEF